MKQELCKTADIPWEGSIPVPFLGREVHVHRTNGTGRAASHTCVHFGGPLDCRDGTSIFAWPGGADDMETGRRTGGPALEGEQLMSLSTRVDDGALYDVWDE